MSSYFFFFFSTSGSTPAENQRALYAEIFFEEMIIEFYILQIAFWSFFHLNAKFSNIILLLLFLFFDDVLFGSPAAKGFDQRFTQLISFAVFREVDPFYAIGLFLYPLKTLKNLWFSDVFRGYRLIPVARNELTQWTVLPCLKTKTDFCQIGIASSKVTPDWYTFYFIWADIYWTWRSWDKHYTVNRACTPPQLGGGGGQTSQKSLCRGGSEIPILVEGEGVILLGGHVILK